MQNIPSSPVIQSAPPLQPTKPVEPTTPVQSSPPVQEQQPQVTTPTPQTAPTQTDGETAQQDGHNAVNAYKKEESKPPRLSLLAGYSFSPNYSGSVDGAQKFKLGASYNLFSQEVGPGKFKLDAGLGLSNTRYQAEVTDPATGYTKVKDKSTFSVDLDLKAKYQMKVASFNDKHNYLFVTPTAMAGVGMDFSGKVNGTYGGGASVGVANKSGWSFGLDANYTNKGGFLGASVAIPLGR
jgi:hypothetical protein